jgi:hypothetical protein
MLLRQNHSCLASRACVERHPLELDHSWRAVLIGVSSLFRETEAREALRGALAQLVAASERGILRQLVTPSVLPHADGDAVFDQGLVAFERAREEGRGRAAVVDSDLVDEIERELEGLNDRCQSMIEGELELSAEDGVRSPMHVVPYRTVDNDIGGLGITSIRVTRPRAAPESGREVCT